MLRAVRSSHSSPCLLPFPRWSVQDPSFPRTSTRPGDPPPLPLPASWHLCPTLGSLRRVHSSFSGGLVSPGLGRRRMPAQPCGRYLLGPPRPSGSAPGASRGAAGSLFSCQQREEMPCQIPDREPKTKVFGPGQQRHRAPVPGSSPGAPRPGGGAARAGRGTPGPPSHPRPAAITPVPARGPSRRPARPGPAVTVPGRAPGARGASAGNSESCDGTGAVGGTRGT